MWLFEAIVSFFERLDRIRDGKLQRLLESRLFEPLLIRGMTANVLTRLREVLALVVIGILLLCRAENYGANLPPSVRLSLLVILLLGFATDMLDGPLARLENKWGTKSSGEGIHLDPFVDKLLTLPLLFYYMLYMDWWWSGSLIALIIMGDIAGTIFRRYSWKREIQIPSNIFGKFKMVFLGAAIVSLILWEQPNALLFLIFSTVALTLGTVSIGQHAFLLKYTLAVRREAQTTKSRIEAPE